MSEQPRDKATGRFAPGQQMTEEHKKKLADARRAKAPAKIRELTEELLESVGLDAKSAPPEMKILAQKAAKGEIAALRLFLSQTKQLVRKESAAPAGGEVYNIVLSQESVVYLSEHGVTWKLCPRCEKAKVSDEV